MSRALLLLATLAVLAFATGCGDDEDGGGERADTAPTQTQPQEEPTTEAPRGGAADPAAVFGEFQNALADGDADELCGLLTPSATKQVEESSIGGSCEDWVEEISGVYTEDLQEKVRNTEVSDVAQSGDSATVKYTSPVLEIPLEVELERSGETWKISKLAEGV